MNGKSHTIDGFFRSRNQAPKNRSYTNQWKPKNRGVRQSFQPAFEKDNYGNSAPRRHSDGDTSYGNTRNTGVIPNWDMGKSRISTSSVGQLSSLIPETGKNDTESILIGTTASNSSRAPSEDEVSLSEAQKRVLDVIMQRKSVFFSGAAGTGKSFVLKILQDVLDRLKLNSVVAFTAPTGVAACNIKGMTVHAWSGVGLAKESLEKLVAQVSRSREARKRWAEAEILVIDEISMLSAELFDIMSKVGSRVRNDPRPFGGLQVILCGDFFQLPPVGLGRNCRFCFESEVWSQLLCEPDSMIVLDKVFRQKDSGFREMLNKIRRGIVDPPTVQQLNKKVAEYRLAQTRGENNMNEDGETKIRSTKLFSKNDKVDAFNTHELGKLDNGPGNAMSFEALDEGVQPYLKQLLNGVKAPQLLELRIGAQVMLLKNLNTSRGLVNGARGVVVAFEPPEKHMDSMFDLLPVVEFLVKGSAVSGNEEGGGMKERLVLQEESWDMKNGDNIVASRLQIPLMLAWAISIHKSQGMTIPFLEVCCEGVFEYGQGYVALSRATDLQGLKLASFGPHYIKAHQQVKQFYESMGYACEKEAETVVKVSVSKFARAYALARSNAKTKAYDDTDDWISSKKPRPTSGYSSSSPMNAVSSSFSMPHVRDGFSARVKNESYISYDDRPDPGPGITAALLEATDGGNFHNNSKLAPNPFKSPAMTTSSSTASGGPSFAQFAYSVDDNCAPRGSNPMTGSGDNGGEGGRGAVTSAAIDLTSSPAPPKAMGAFSAGWDGSTGPAGAQGTTTYDLIMNAGTTSGGSGSGMNNGMNNDVDRQQNMGFTGSRQGRSGTQGQEEGPVTSASQQHMNTPKRAAPQGPSGLSDEAKRRIEANRQKAMQRLEENKRARASAVDQAVNTFQTPSWFD